MKKSELKQIIKPMVAECIKESLLEDGILSTVISEVVKGMNSQLMVEHPVVPIAPPRKKERGETTTKQLQEVKEKMLTAIGQNAYGGVDIFEGTTPAPAAARQDSHGPLKDTDPNDAGVDISELFNNNWSKLV
jgi:hypothetical protein